MSKAGSSGRHGGGHKDPQRGANKSERVQAERAKQARIAKQRGERDRSGKKAKDKSGYSEGDLGLLDL